MNTRDLEYFVKLVEVKNFSRVADHFKVAQPTITMALKRLETHFEVQLIHRDQSHGLLTVTTAGQQLYQRAQIIITQMKLAEVELSRTRNSKVRLGLPPILGNYYFPQIARSLIGQGLMNQIDTVEAGSDDLFEKIKHGDLEIALLGSSGSKKDDGLDITQIASTPFSVIVPKDHPLAQRRSVMFAELEQYPFVLLSSGFIHVQAFRWFTKASGTDPNVVYRTTDVAMLKSMIKQGVGIGFLTDIAITPEDGLAEIRLDDEQQPQFVISVVHRKNQVLLPAVQQLKQILIDK